MQHPQAQLGSGPRPNPQAADAQNPEGASPDSRNHEALLADARLVKRCLAGEPAAWEEFYAQCHRPLLLSIEVMLGPDHADPNLVDEIAARVWYALLENDGRLLAQYDPNRGGRLITFLQTVARTGVRRHFRRERRRQNRERIALLGKSRHQRPDDAQMTALIRTSPGMCDVTVGATV